MKGSTQSEQKWPANILPYGEALSFPLMACCFCCETSCVLISSLLPGLATILFPLLTCSLSPDIPELFLMALSKRRRAELKLS